MRAPSAQRVVIPAKDHLVSSRPHLKSRAGRSQACGREDANAGTGAPGAAWAVRRDCSTYRDASGWYTGARRGLGSRCAEVWPGGGRPVALAARRKEKLAAVQARIEQAGGRAVAI